MKSRKLISLEQFQYLSLIIFAFLMIGMGQLIRAEFKWEVFYDLSVWTEIMYSFTAHLSIIMGGHKWKKYNENQGNKEIIDKRTIIKTFNLKDKDVDFYDYVRKVDRENKKDAWINKIQRKIDKCELKNKTKRAEKLRRFITDEYIDSRINILRVRYNRITPKMVLNDPTRDDEFDEGFVSGTKFMFDYLTPKILMMLGGTMYSKTIIPIFQQPDATTMYTLIYDSFILLISFVWGTGLASSYIEKVTIANLDYSIHIIKRYLTSKRGEVNGN